MVHPQELQLKKADRKSHWIHVMIGPSTSDSPLIFGCLKLNFLFCFDLFSGGMLVYQEETDQCLGGFLGIVGQDPSVFQDQLGTR